MKLIPPSRAAWMMRTESSWSVLPQAPNIIAPRHSGLTCMPVRPSGRCSMTVEPTAVPRAAMVRPTTAALGVRVGGARPRPAPGRAAAARRAGARAPARALRQLARPRQGAFDRAAAPAARSLARCALQAPPEATWAPALVEEVAATGAVDTIEFKGCYGWAA